MRLQGLLLVALVLSGCASSTTPTVPLNQEFTLAPTESAAIEGTSNVIRFIGVEGDSRCPADALCIQGGDARVKIEVRSPQVPQPYDLHTGDLKPVVHDGLTITLVQLTPYPFSTRTISPGEYRATLRVTK